jgi:ATP-dependent DNA helicase RecG
MDAAWLQSTLDELVLRPAGEVECETLEIKSWCKDERKLAEELTEAVVCLANAQGGYVMLGLDDRERGRRAVSYCPHAVVTDKWIKAKILDLTKPPVQCGVYRVGDVIPSAGSGYENLFVVEVQKPSRPGGHRTNWGVSYKRSNKECRIEYYEGNDDYSRALVDHLGFDDLDSIAIKSAAAHRELAIPSIRRLRTDPTDHLFEFELLQGARKSPTITVAASLLFGSSDSLKSNFPQSETVLMVWPSPNKPLTDSRWNNIISGLKLHLQWISQHLPRSIAEHLADEVVRELLLNAYLHRDYRVPSPIHVHVRPDEIEIQNPGGLLGALTVESLIHSPPNYRNFLLADSARQYGYCEKAGTGVDKVFHNLACSLKIPTVLR